MRRARCLTVLLACALVGGCTVTAEGRPTPAQTETSGALPDRPRELPLDDVDPCSLVPESDYHRFYIEKPGEPGEHEPTSSPDCFYSTDVGSFSITTVTTEGVEPWLDGSRIAEAEQIPPISSFPAIGITLPADETRCDIAIDVADGQHLLATVIVSPSKAAEVPAPCEYARQLAESAMGTLASR